MPSNLSSCFTVVKGLSTNRYEFGINIHAYIILKQSFHVHDNILSFNLTTVFFIFIICHISELARYE